MDLPKLTYNKTVNLQDLNDTGTLYSKIISRKESIDYLRALLEKKGLLHEVKKSKY